MRNIRNLEILLLAILLACLARTVPLQHYIPLSRYQHSALAMYIWGLGFVVQAIWSWKNIATIGKAALLSAGAYVLISAFVLYCNPWLDTRVSLQTTEQYEFRWMLSRGSIAGGIIVGYLWLLWGIAEYRRVAREEAE